MNYYLPGKVTDLSQINPGECIMFSANQGIRLGIAIQSANGDKSILDFDYADSDGTTRFQIYNGSNFLNESIIALDKARIVPVLDPAAMNLGMHNNNNRISRALYLTDQGPVAYAGIHQTAFKINLDNGTVYQGDIAYQIHTTRWRIEIETGTGEFQTVRDISA